MSCSRKIDDLIRTNKSLADERDRKEEIIKLQGSTIARVKRQVSNITQVTTEADREFEEEIRDRDRQIRDLQLQLDASGEVFAFYRCFLPFVGKLKKKLRGDH